MRYIGWSSNKFCDNLKNIGVFSPYLGRGELGDFWKSLAEINVNHGCLVVFETNSLPRELKEFKRNNDSLPLKIVKVFHLDDF